MKKIIILLLFTSIYFVQAKNKLPKYYSHDWRCNLTFSNKFWDPCQQE